MSEAAKPFQFVALGPDDEQERQKWIDALTRVVDNNAYCLGPEVAAFEAQATKFLNIEHALGVSNGSDALILALRAVGVGAGDEVIVPAYSFFASASAIAHLGAKPVFVDITPDTLTIEPKAIEAAVSPRTRAVMPVHLYGQGAHMDEITAICSRLKLAIVEDSAQCFGVRYGDQTLGGIGDVGTYSFYPTKNLGAPGDAGMVATNNSEIAERLRSLRMHGDAGGYQHTSLGWNMRMDGFIGAILQLQLDELPRREEARAKNAAYYLGEIEKRGLSQAVQPLGRTPKSDHCWHQFIVRIQERRKVKEALDQAKIPNGIYYPGSLPSQPAFADLGHQEGEFPVAEAASKEVLAFPVHHRLEQEQLKSLLDTVEQSLS